MKLQCKKMNMRSHVLLVSNPFFVVLYHFAHCVALLSIWSVHEWETSAMLWLRTVQHLHLPFILIMQLVILRCRFSRLVNNSEFTHLFRAQYYDSCSHFCHVPWTKPCSVGRYFKAKKKSTGENKNLYSVVYIAKELHLLVTHNISWKHIYPHMYCIIQYWNAIFTCAEKACEVCIYIDLNVQQLCTIITHKIFIALNLFWLWEQCIMLDDLHAAVECTGCNDCRDGQ